MTRPNSDSPYKLYTPALREPLPLRRKPYILPAPPESPDKPQKINWLSTLLPPLIMVVVLSIVSMATNMGNFIFYTMIMIGVYPIARVVAHVFEKTKYDKKEAQRKMAYAVSLQNAAEELTSYIRRQSELLEGEFLSTSQVINIAQTGGQKRTLWYRTNSAVDFLALRMGTFTGNPSFPILLPKDNHEVDFKDPLLKDAKNLQASFEHIHQIPYLFNLKEIGSVALLGANQLRYGLAHRILLDILVHHRPDEVEVYVLSNHNKAPKLWGWLRWVPHCKVFEMEKELNHLFFSNPEIKIFLARFENFIKKHNHGVHQVFIVDVDGIQQYDDDFIGELITKSNEWNLSLIFVGGEQIPRSVRGVIHLTDPREALFVDTKVNTSDKTEKEYHTQITLDDFPTIEQCEEVARSLAGIKLLSSAGGELLAPNISLFDVIDLGEDEKLTFDDVLRNWKHGEPQGSGNFSDVELLQFPLGLIEENAKLIAYNLNLLEASLGGNDAYHTMLIGTTGSGKSELIKSLILGATYKYPPQYLNLFCMDFKGGSTFDYLKELPHVVGVMTNLDEVLAQRGLVAIQYEINRRQAEFQKTKAKDIWDYNDGIAIKDRMPHLILVLDEFTRGLDILNDTQFNLQDLLEKRLVPQGRSLGIYLILANQVANAKAMRLMPNIGWKIALRVASREQMSFIDAGLKPPKYAGRGYIQSLGEDPIEFQSGYSGNYVNYSNMRIKQKNVIIQELFPNGNTLILRETEKHTDADLKNDAFLEMNQVIQSIKTAQKVLKIADAKKIYLPPMPRNIDMSYPALQLKRDAYRDFTKNTWSKEKKQKGFLQIPAGIVDITQKCIQEPLVLDFNAKTPHLLIAGSQSDLNEGLRSILFPLLSTHSPDDLHLYLLEFGKGMRDIPSYPHIGDILLEKESEKISRTITFFKEELRKREEGKTALEKLPHLFLIINNLAGLHNKLSWYEKVIQFIAKESHNYGIHIIALVLPQGTGSRVPLGDLKMFKSRIVYPSINHDNYYNYLDITEHKLVKLTRTDELTDPEENKYRSRAYWLSLNDPRFEKPLEIQLALPKYGEEFDENIFSLKNNRNKYNLPSPIKILEEKYPLILSSSSDKFLAGVNRLNLQDVSVPFDKFPIIWGVSGPNRSGKTNFLTSFLHQVVQTKTKCEIDVFSPSPNQLTNYCENEGYRSEYGTEKILNRMTKIIKDENFVGRKKFRLFLIDDVNFFWEHNDSECQAIIKSLNDLTNNLYRKSNVMLVSSFNYSAQLRSAMHRDIFMRELSNNKTGLCLGYEGDWLINSMDLSKYTKELDVIIPPGRGVFVLSRKEMELQSFFYKEED